MIKSTEFIVNCKKYWFHDLFIYSSSSLFKVYMICAMILLCYNNLSLLCFCFRFKSGQSNNIPISRASSNQTPNPRRIARDQQQFSSPGNPFYSRNLSGRASSVGRVQGLSEKELTRPHQDFLLAQEPNLQPNWNFPRPRENYPQAHEMTESTMTCNQTVTSSQHVS